MAFTDFFKKKQAREKLDRREEPKQVHAEGKAKDAPSASEPVVPAGSSRIADVILERPHITEKSANLAENGVYVFRVAASSTRRSIKRAVEELYHVRVRKVNVISVPARAMRFGRHPGMRSGYRKGVLTLAKGDKIEFV